jgi:hypothetical protein
MTGFSEKKHLLSESRIDFFALYVVKATHGGLPKRFSERRMSMSGQDAGLHTELQEQITAMQKEVLPQIPEAVVEVLVRTTEDQVKSGVVDKALKVGDKAPNFTLPNLHGESVSLSDLLAKGPAVVAFYRGAW